MSKVKCVLAINKPEMENWMHGVSREGNLAKFPIWEEIEVVDILQQPKDIISSIENNYPSIVFVSNTAGEMDSIKMTLKKCKQFYSDVRIILLLYVNTPENTKLAQELIYFCVDNEITSDLLIKVTAMTIQKSISTTMTYEQAAELKDPDFVPTPYVAEKVAPLQSSSSTEAEGLPKKKSISDFISRKSEKDNTDNQKDLENKQHEEQLRLEQEKTRKQQEEKERLEKEQQILKERRQQEENERLKKEEQLLQERKQQETRDREEFLRQQNEFEEKERVARQEQARLQREEQEKQAFEQQSRAEEENLKRERQERQEREAQEAQLEAVAKEQERLAQLQAQSTTPATSETAEPTSGGSKLAGMIKRNKNVIKMEQDESPVAPQQPQFPMGQVPNMQAAPALHRGPSQFVNPKVVTVWSPKAIGKTTVLANMGVQAAKLGIKTIATDMNVVTHDLGAYFGLPRKTPGLEQLLQYSITEDSIRSLLHTKCGVDVLPIGMERARYDLTIEEHQVKDIINILTRRMEYTLILADICNIIDEVATATMFSQSDVIYLVVDQNKSFLEDVHNDLIFAEEVMQIPRNKFRLIINNYVARCDMSQSRIENFLRMPAVAVIPSDRYGHIQAVNYGKPYCTTKTEDAAVWNSLVSNAIGKDIEEKSGVLSKFSKLFKS